MSANKISRNDPCPCGSGKKFKNCCISKGIDWDARQSHGLPKPPRPRTSAPPADFSLFMPFGVVDAKLKEVAGGTPGSAEWKARVERLSPSSPAEDRLETYQLVRQAGVLPDDAAGFLFGHAAQWMLKEGDLDEGHFLHRAGQPDLADLYASDLLDYQRRYERGRQFFFGPPDEELERQLREKGVIQ